MTAKEYLSEVQRLQTIIEQKQERIKEIREKASTVRAVRFDFWKVQDSRQTDRIGETAAKIVDLETEVKNDIMDLIYYRHEAINQIHKLNNVLYIQLLFKRYIEGKDFKTIAHETKFAYDYVKTVHKPALKAFETANKESLEKA